MTNVCNRPQELIILPADKGHEEILIGLLLDSNDDFMAFLPLTNERQDERGRILEVGIQSDNAIPIGLLKAIDRGTHNTEVPCVENRLDILILGTDSSYDRLGIILRVIIDIDNLVVILRQLICEDIHQCFIERKYILLLIIGRHNDRYQFLFHTTPFFH